ncbi:MAG: hydroxyacid dehydrogenase [Nitrospira sp.]|nr:hydroxyacid dehydrogenase [Nitrospira sp.]
MAFLANHNMQKPKALVVGADYCLDSIYDERVLRRLSEYAILIRPPQRTTELFKQLDILASVEVLCTTWGAPLLDEALLTAAPNLRVVLHAGGTVRGLMSDLAWARGIKVASAYAANAIPVAEFAAATLILALKGVFPHMRAAEGNTRQRTLATDYAARNKCFGNYRRTIGLVSYGAIARLVRGQLRAGEHKVLVYDPFVTQATAQAEEIESVTLEALFSRADAVSVHAPLLPATTGLIHGGHIAKLKPGAIFLNTARGAIVREHEMIDTLRVRPDIQAILDVTWPDPPEPDSPLFTLPNVFLTPHIAGAFGSELARLGETVADELARFAAGQSLRWAITPEQFARMA